MKAKRRIWAISVLTILVITSTMTVFAAAKNVRFYGHSGGSAIGYLEDNGSSATGRTENPPSQQSSTHKVEARITSWCDIEGKTYSQSGTISNTTSTASVIFHRYSNDTARSKHVLYRLGSWEAEIDLTLP